MFLSGNDEIKRQSMALATIVSPSYSTLQCVITLLMAKVASRCMDRLRGFPQYSMYYQRVTIYNYSVNARGGHC